MSNQLRTDEELALQIQDLIATHGEEVLPNVVRNFYHNYSLQNGGTTTPSVPTQQAPVQEQVQAPIGNQTYSQGRATPNRYDMGAFDRLTAATNDKLGKIEEASQRKQRALDAFDKSIAARQSTFGQVTGLGIDSDLSREFIENTLSGAGTAAKGVGDFASLLGLGSGTTGNAINETLQGLAGEIDEQQSFDFRNKMIAATPEGDLFDPSTWTIKDLSIEGILGHFAAMGGQFTPQLAAMILTRGGSLAAQSAATAATGAAQAGGGAASEQEEYIDSLDAIGLEKASGLYRDLITAGKSHEEAKAQTKEAASKSALVSAGAVGGLGGALTNYILRPLNDKLTGSLAKRAGQLVGVSSVEEGIQEVAEGVAAKTASNLAIGGDQDVTEGSLTNAVMGAAFGGGLGAGKLAIDEAGKAVNRAAETGARMAAEDTLAEQVVAETTQAAETATPTPTATNTKAPVMQEKVEDLDPNDEDAFNKLVDLNPVKAAEVVSAQATDEASKLKSLFKVIQTRAFLDQRIESATNAIAEGTKNGQDTKALEKELDSLRDSREKVQGISDELMTRKFDESASVDAQERKEEVLNEAIEGDVEAAEATTTLLMENPTTYTRAQLQKLLDSQNANLSPEQRKYIDRVQALEAQLNDIKADDVTAMIRNGEVGYKGLRDYETAFNTAIAGNNLERAEKQIEQLSDFVATHKQKLDAIQRAKSASVATGRNRDNSFPVAFNAESKEWEVLPQGADTGKYNGALEVHKGTPIDNSIRNEIALMENTLARLQAGLELKESVQPSVLDQAPLDNQSTSELNESQGTEQTVQDQTSSKQENVDSVASDLTPNLDESQVPNVTGGESTQGNTSDLEPPPLSDDEIDQQASQEVEEDVEAPTADQTPTAPAEPEPDSQVVAEEEAPVVVEPKPEEGKFNRTEEKEKQYNERNPFLAYFKRAKDKFITKANEFANDPAAFIPETGLSEEGWRAINHFAAKFKEWQPNVINSMSKDKGKFNFQDSVNFLRGEDGQFPEEVHMAIAYAAYTHIAEDSTLSDLNDDDTMLGLMSLSDGDDLIIPQEAEEELRFVGNLRNNVIYSLGQRAAQAIGYKPYKDAPIDVMERVYTSLGNQVLALLQDLDLVEDVKADLGKAKFFTNQVNGLSDATTYDSAIATFTRFKQNQGSEHNSRPDKEHPNRAKFEEIVDAQRGSSGALGDLFKSPSAKTPPSFEPIEKVQQKAKGTNEDVPSELKETLEKAQKEPFQLRERETELFELLGNDSIEKLVGIEDETNLQAGRANAVKSKNNGLRKEIENFRNFLTEIGNTEKGKDSPFFLSRVVWKVFRVGYDSTINPQTSNGLHRHLVKMSAWESEVSFNDAASYDNFLLGVAEGLGVKTDKNLNEDSLKELELKLESDKVKAAIAALQYVRENGSITPEHESAIANVGGFHAIEALTAHVDMLEAKASGQSSFKTSLMREVDGVNNGPILLQAQLAAATSPRALQQLLEKGGFFSKDSPYKDVVAWKKDTGSHDLYESLAAKIAARFGSVINNDPTSTQAQQITAFYNLVGGEFLKSDGSVSGDGRNAVKTPITAFMFGSGVDKAVGGVVTELPKAFYAKLQEIHTDMYAAAADKNPEKLALLKAEATALVQSMNQFLSPRNQLRPPSKASDLLKYNLSSVQVNQLRGTFMSGVGEAIVDTMEVEYEQLIEGRNTLNKIADLSYQIFEQVYVKVEGEYLQRLRDEGLIQSYEYKTKHGSVTRYDRDISEVERLEILEQVKEAYPLLQSAMAKDSGELGSGIAMAKLTEASYYNYLYQSESNTTVKGRKKTFNSNGKRQTFEAPGVFGPISYTHSFDSGIASRTYAAFQALNVHDALGFGLQDTSNGAEKLNQTTFEMLRDHSLPMEMVAMLNRVVEGADAIDPNIAIEIFEAAREKERKRLFAQYKAEEISRDEMKAAQNALGDTGIEYLSHFTSYVTNFAIARTTAKLQVLGRTGSVNQYGLEGGQFELSEADQQSALDKIPNLYADLHAKPEVVTPEPEAPVVPLNNVDGIWGEVGVSDTPSDPAIEQELRKNGKMSLRDLLPTLNKSIMDSSPRGYSLLLRDIAKRISHNTEIVYVRPDTPTKIFGKDVINARGWMHYENGKKTLYIKSSEFKTSGITPELILHELLHVALVQTVDSPTKEAQPFVTELESLLEKVNEAAKADLRFLKYENALENVHELLAWGLTDPGFQKLLSEVEFETQNKGKVKNALFDFFRIIKGLIYGKNTPKNNALSALVVNASGLMEARDAYFEAKNAEREAKKKQPLVITVKKGVSKNEAKKEKRRQSLTSIDVDTDRLIVAVAKLGGIDRAEAEAQGIDPASWAGTSNTSKSALSPTRPVFRKTGGLSFDHMAEALNEFGYMPSGGVDPNTLLELLSNDLAEFEAGTGDAIYSNYQNPDIRFQQEYEDKYEGDNYDSPYLDENTPEYTTVWGDASNAEQVTLLQQASTAPTQFTTAQIFDALANSDGLDSEQKTRLSNIVNNVVTKVHGAFGAYSMVWDKAQSLSTVDTFLASLTGLDPFVSNALGKLNLTNAEAYVLQQVEMTMRTAFDNSHASYTEMTRVYREAKKTLKPSDFPNPNDYDFIFNSDGDKSMKMSSFAAMAMVYPPLIANMEKVTLPSKVGKALNQSVEGWFAQQLLRVLTSLSNAMPKFANGTGALTHLDHLVRHLVDLDGKNKALLSKQRSKTIDQAEGFAKKGSDALRKAVSDFGQSKVVQNTPTNVISGLGQVVSAVAGGRGDVMVEHLIKAKNKNVKGLNGAINGLVNEIRGATDGTRVFYKLLSKSNAFQRERKRLIEGYADVVLKGFKDEGRNLDRGQLESITRVFVRTDAQVLVDAIELGGVTAILNDNARLEAEIKAWEAKLTGANQHYYQRQAMDLGFHLATGYVSSPDLMLNAHNIAYLANTTEFINKPDAQADAAKKVIDVLASLYAMRHVPPSMKTTAAEVLNTENNRTDNENGVEAVLSIHRSLQKQAYETLFDNNPTNFMKGYTKEIYDPHRDVQLVPEEEWAEWEARGYTPTEVLAQDPDDPDFNKTRKRLFYANTGKEAHTTGVISYTGKRARGSSVHSGTVTSTGGAYSVANINENKRITKRKQHRKADLFKPNPGYKPKAGTHLVATIKHDGTAENYRYLMNEDTKSRLLNKNNQVTSVLGGMAGSNYDKLHTEGNNALAIKALKEHYNMNFAGNADDFIEVSLNSPDARIRETFALLPDETKRHIRQTWGANQMFVPKDVFDIMFGYRKASAANAFDIEREKRNIMEKLITVLPEALFGKKAGLRIAQAEDVWQEIVVQVKDILVIKNLFTLLGNISSNVSLLLISGVNPVEIYTHHATAIKGYISYQRDEKELLKVNALLDSDYLGNYSLSELQERKAELEESINRNPVKEMVDRGMMQTIVEDVDVSEDGFSYQSRAAQFLSDKTAWVPDELKSVGKELFLTHDTPLYQILSQTTSMSDFVARYTLLQHLTTRENSPLSKDDAYSRIEEAFIQYDVPSHIGLQYLNDVGLLFFMKYFLRIQKVLFQVFQENPARSLSAVAFGEFFSSIPLVTESNFLERIGNNPFSAGALELPGAVDEIATIAGLTSPF